MNELDFSLETKALDDDGYVEGLAAGYGNLDLGGDIILPGALAKSLSGRKSVPMLMFHDQKRPAGVWNSFEEKPEGLFVKGRFSMSTRAGKEAHGLVKDGAIGGLSIGFNAVKEKVVGKARHLAEIMLHEISLVTIPMNQKSLITGFKAVEELREIFERGEQPSLSLIEKHLRDGGFPDSLATAFVSLGKGAFRQGDPGAETNDPLKFLQALRG
ncbi:HK97 family phage prohead protease [Asticcacaulis sp.]|uniref:HK97 family phage prohead protease n=1 Tax=Asticcacaulis sp. TaxID=1872648 RepID=UPI003F7B5CAB